MPCICARYKSVLVLYKCQVKEHAVILNGQFLLYFKSLVNKGIVFNYNVMLYLGSDSEAISKIKI
jgi:hypothetical protein